MVTLVVVDVVVDDRGSDSGLVDVGDVGHVDDPFVASIVQCCVDLVVHRIN